ncbi:hypothetical protein B0H10DRAFT_2215946 [Mycena sp. CBHHK59/15]|nr:hypothetical protein B0H10DRAFT_2215946 [Mycena sp. CBHHK59/15]
MLPPTPVSPAASPVISNATEEMWRSIKGRGANISETEKILNNVTDITTMTVSASNATDGVVGFVKGVVANEDGQAIGKTILEGVPALMSALEVLTDVHPFLKAAFLPFKLIYHQEVQRHDNDQKRNTLFEKIKDLMLVLLELKGFAQDDTRKTPDGQPILSRLAPICEDMKKDTEDCYKVLNAQDKRSVGIKFLKASLWAKELATYGSRFKARREDLNFALHMRTAVTVEEISDNMKIMMQMFSNMLSPQERDMERWINLNGGEKSVMASDAKCAAMLKFKVSLSTDSGPMSSSRTDKGKDKVDDAKAIAALRKEYRDDIQSIIKENFESYSKRFDMGLDTLGKDLGNKINHQGDRVIKFLGGGPHTRIKDKIIYHIWKDQDWKGSTKTRLLVLAVRDYLVERVERSSMSAQQDPTQNRLSTVAPLDPDHDDDDPETDINVPLPDSWMTAYLQIKHLRYLQQAFDADSSGFTTISEINVFTRARPRDWILPRWISYWAIGWQIFATKYCIEIEDLFAQMLLLRTQIGIHMPGNKCYVNGYIEGTWQYVTALTSSIEHYDSPGEWLTEKFSSYVETHENILKERLKKIQYDIDALDTVTLILGGDKIEQSIFVLIALLMRRHLAKMHLCLKQEIDSRELDDDMDTVTWVVAAVWHRFVELKEHFQHQQVADLKQTFEWLSCGLFKNYWDWNDWTNPKYFMDSDMTAWSSVDTVRELEPSELTKILVYHDGPDSENESSAGSSPEETETAPSSPAAPKPSLAEMSISGTWHGYHWTKTRKPFMAMLSLNIQCGEKLIEEDNQTKLSAGFVCDPCEETIDDMAAWDLQKRYRSEVPKKEDSGPVPHNVFHLLVRLAQKPEVDDRDQAAISKSAGNSIPSKEWEQVEQRIEELVTMRFEAVQSHVDKRLEEVESRLITGLANIERLLQSMAA